VQRASKVKTTKEEIQLEVTVKQSDDIAYKYIGLGLRIIDREPKEILKSDNYSPDPYKDLAYYVYYNQF
jgi:hypothetical protein